jgi:predicted CoA-substrate-specific enzyme activase
VGYFLGIDVGSSTAKAVILNGNGEVAGYGIVQTEANSTEAAERALEKALFEANIGHERLKGSVATGYGRISVPFAEKMITEITCHGLGAYHLYPETGTVIDLGGQDSKVIRIGSRGRVMDFSMNDKCAAGTGRFLEVMAARLKIPLDELGALSLRAEQEVQISSVCTVFAESEVVSLVAQNYPKQEIVRGLHRAIVNRMWSLIRSIGIHGGVTMTGGVSKNKGVVLLLEQRLGKAVNVYHEPQIVGALGAALLARRET